MREREGKYPLKRERKYKKDLIKIIIILKQLPIYLKMNIFTLYI